MADALQADPALLARAARVAVLVLDVDGVLTDGRLYYSDTGGESKAFHVRDGYGLKAVQREGIQVAVISGRRSAAVERRLDELGIRLRALGRDDKLAALDELLAGSELADYGRVACVGDDVPDLAIMQVACVAIAVADAHPAVLAAAHARTALPGGHGAVREVCDLLVAARQRASS